MGTRLLRAIIAVVLVAVSLVAITVQPASAINQSATGVLGQGVSFTSSTGNTTVTGMKAPSGVALDTVNHRLFVADKTNNRVLEFDCDNSNCSRRRYCRPRAGPIAFYYKRYRLTQSTLNTPIGLVFDSSNNRLYVADSTNNRILVFNTSTIIDGMNAAYVIGQANFTSNAATVDNATLNGPQYMDLDAAGNRLFVADAIHNRILIWNVSSISNGMIANNVLGQSTFSASAIATTQGGTSTPTGVAYDATAQNLYVTESGNRRVVVYAVGSVTDGMNANYVIGQSTFTSNTSATTQAGLGATVGAVAVDPATHKLYVVDTGNSRVMGYDTSTLSNGPNAVDVIGQSSFTGGTGGTSKLAINGPTGIGYDAGQKRLYVADTTSNRTVWYDLPQATPAASLLGQSGSFSANAASTTSTGMNGAAGSAVDTTNHRLFVADKTNNRVLVFNCNASKCAARCNRRQCAWSVIVYRQWNRPHSINIERSSWSRLRCHKQPVICCGPRNNRVLIFSTSSITDGMNATYVLGQANYTSNATTTDSATLSAPTGAEFDATGTRIFVSDTAHNRVMNWSVSSITNGMAAVHVLGQSIYTTSAPATTQGGMSAPTGLAFDNAGSRLFVGDSTNTRVLIYSTSTITDGMNAAFLFGHTTFTTPAASVSQSRLSSVGGVVFDSDKQKLYVSDSAANRILIFDTLAITNGQNAVAQLGQNTYTLSTSSTSQTGLNNPGQLSYDPTAQRLYVADQGSNRVVWFNLVWTNASMVIGQGGYTTSSTGSSAIGLNTPSTVTIDSTNHRLFVIDGANNRILVYNCDAYNNPLDGTADYVLGVSSFITGTPGTTASTMSGAAGLAFDSVNNRLFVADSGNNRVLVFNTATITNGMSASNVLGQTDFTTGSSGNTQSRMFGPTGLAYDSGNSRLWVADTQSNRVLSFNVASITDGMNAAHVLGQSLFTTATSATTQSGMKHPNKVAVDATNNRLFVTDYFNYRVLAYSTSTVTDGMNATNVLGQTGFTTLGTTSNPGGLNLPDGIAMDPVNNMVYVSDVNNNRVLGYNTSSITNGMSASIAVGQPTLNLATSTLTRTGISTTGAAGDVAIDPGSKRLYVVDQIANRVLVYDLGTAPNMPTSPAQYQSNGTTNLTVGSTAGTTTMVFKGATSDTDSYDNDQLCVEVKLTSAAFTNADTACGTAVTQGTTASVTVSGLTAGASYHWQVRSKDGAGFYSSWNPFGGNSDVVTAATDFSVNNAPGTPTALAQYKSDGTTGIPGTTRYSFDSSLVNWHDGGSPNGSLALSTSTKRNGAGSMQVNIGSGYQSLGEYEGATGTFDYSSGGPTISAWVYMSPSDTGSGWFSRISVEDSSGVFHDGPNISLTSGKWTLITFTPGISVLSSMHNFVFQVENSAGDATGTNTFNIDDLQQGSGTWTNENSVVFKGATSDPDASDTDALCIEAQPIGTAFTNTETACGTAVTQGSVASLTLSSLTNGSQYHWQARTKDSTNTYSTWTSFGGNTDTVTASPDFGIDTTAPTAGSVTDGPTQGVDVNYNSGALDTLSANWTGFSDPASGLGYYEYSIGTSAGGTTTSSGWIKVDPTTTSVTKTGLNLKTGTIYYFNLRAIDTAGNTSTYVSTDGQSAAPSLTFTVSSPSITFGHLNALDAYTSTTSVNLTTSTNAYGGYVVRQYSKNPFTSSSNTLPNYSATYASPATWSGTGFGYTSSDTSIQSSGDLFGSGTKYAAVTSSSPGDVVADHTSNVTGTPISGETFTMGYKLVVDPGQQSGAYGTNLMFTATATF